MRRRKLPWPTLENGCDTGKGVEYLPNGMRILDRQKIAPIHVVSGDHITCTYTQEWREGNKIIARTQHALATHPFDAARIIDTVMILELDDGTLESMGLQSGIAAVFGEGNA